MIFKTFSKLGMPFGLNTLRHVQWEPREQNGLSDPLPCKARKCN